MLLKGCVTFASDAKFLHVGALATAEVLVVEDGSKRFDARVVVVNAGANHGANDLELLTQGDDIVVGEPPPRSA